MRGILQQTLLPAVIALFGLACLTGNATQASAQDTDASVTMQISARMLSSHGAQVTNASETGTSGIGDGGTVATAGTPASGAGDASPASGDGPSPGMYPAAAWKLPVWDSTGVAPDARSQYVIEVGQHAPVTVQFDVTGEFAGSERSMARVFSSINDTRELSTGMIARLESGTSLQLSGGQYFFDMGGDFDVEDRSIGVYEGIFTLTLIYN